jgi:MoxR-like ATPase
MKEEKLLTRQVREQVARLSEALTSVLHEREEVMKLALLSAIAGESIFLLGPPGVGKSLVARRLKFAFRDGKSFEYLMSKFSTPDEIFGPVSISKLRDEDKYERKTENYLPGAHIVFLDEIWKAGPAIQNALLTILNEKIYRNGEEDISVNIRAILTASNELPPADQSLAPIWDRFLLRYEMGNIRKLDRFLDMITDTRDVYVDTVPEDVKLDAAILDEWNQAIKQMALPEEVLNTLQVVKIELEKYNELPQTAFPIRVFDRRWKKIVRLLRTSAFLNGREQVDLMDCYLMVHCLWSRPEQKEVLERIVTEAVRQHGYSLAINLKMIRQEVEDFEEDVDQEIRIRHQVTEEQLLPVDDEYYRLEPMDEVFEGDRVRIKDHRELSLEEERVTNVYDAENNLVNRLKIRLGKAEHSLEINFNSRIYQARLRTHKTTRTEIIRKKPHPLVLKFWEERYQRVEDYLKNQLGRIEKESGRYSEETEMHHFVPQTFASVVLANMEEMKDSLKKLLLRLEKLRYQYSEEHA